MRLEPKAKPVRIRIVSGGEEHSSVETLKRCFDYRDVSCISAETLFRWLRQCAQEKIAKQLEEAKSLCHDNVEEWGMMIASALFDSESDQQLTRWDDLVEFWLSHEEYASNINRAPIEKISKSLLMDDRLLCLLKERPELLKEKISCNVGKYLGHKDPFIREAARRILQSIKDKELVQENEYDDLISHSNRNELDAIRFRFFNQLSKDEEVEFDLLREDVDCWLRTQVYNKDNKIIIFSNQGGRSAKLKHFYYYTELVVGLINTFNSFVWKSKIIDDKKNTLYVINANGLKSRVDSKLRPFLNYVLLSAAAFFFDNEVYDNEVQTMLKEFGLLIDCSDMRKNVTDLKGISRSNLSTLFNHDWKNDTLGYKIAMVSILKEVFSLPNG